MDILRAISVMAPLAGLAACFWVTGICRAAAPQGGAPTINSVETIIGDMELPGDALPHGVPTSYDWCRKGRVGLGNNPGNFGAMIAWGQVYEPAEGNPARNTRVRIRNMAAYYLSKSDGKWHLLQKSAGVDGASYREDFVDDINQPAPIKKLKDGSVAVTAGQGFNYHFWPTTGRVAIKKNDIAGIFTTVQACLIVDDGSKPDDRSAAKYLLSMGGDYWLNPTAGWDGFRTNGDIGISRFKYVTSEWQAFNMSTLSPSELRKNPPPLE